VKEVRTEIENESDHVNDLAIRLGIVIVITERIGTTGTETGIGIGRGTEVRKGTEKETVDVIEREDAIVVGNVIVIERGIMNGM